MKQKITSFLKFLLFLSIGVTILYFVFKSQNQSYQAECALKGIPSESCSLWKKLLDDFRSTNLFWIFMMLLAFMMSNLSRAIRWLLLIRPLGYTPRLYNSFFTIMLGYFANLGLPRSGEVLRAGAFGRYEKISLDKTMGTVVVDRIMDVVCLATVMALAFLLEYDTVWTYLQANTSLGEKGGLLQKIALLFGGFAFLLGGIFLVFRQKLLQTTFFKKIVTLLLGFWEGFKTIAQLQKPWLFLFHTFVIWAMYYAMTYFAFLSFPPTTTLAPVVALVVFVFGGLGIVIPSPGGMGTYHFLVIAALELYGVSGDNAFSLANIAFFSINIFGNIFFGILAIILLPILNRNYQPAARVFV